MGNKQRGSENQDYERKVVDEQKQEQEFPKSATSS